MQEKFEDRRLTGRIHVTCKFEDGTVRVWDADKYETVAAIVAIVNRYRKDGYKLTLRQLHYQLVTKNLIVNHDTAYKKLGGILDDCRYSGVIDWNDIEDRGRVPYIPYSVTDSQEALQDAIDYFRIDRQEGQPNVVELWSEKDALSGILKRTTEKYHVRLIINKGYGSSSSMYAAYQRALKALEAGKKFTILYFGDHDPSGLDMVRDIRERLMFMLCNGSGRSNKPIWDAVYKWWCDSSMDMYLLSVAGYIDEKAMQVMHDESASETKRDEAYNAFEAGRTKMWIEENEMVRVVAIGLTKAQVTAYKLPPNPTKLTDTRADAYVKVHGKTCWEVDALNPETLTGIVEENIIATIDGGIFNKALARQTSELKKLKAFVGKKPPNKK